MSDEFGWADQKLRDSKSDSDAVWEVMRGTGSRWEPFIKNNWDAARKVFLKKYQDSGFTIVSPEQFDGDAEASGITHKDKATIELKEVGYHSGNTSLILALHELVHWVSHPPDQGKDVTAGILLHHGLIEGLTQIVTEDILAAQKIRKSEQEIYVERVAIVNKMMDRFGFELFGKALFVGHYSELRDAFASDWGLETKTLAKLWMFADCNQRDHAIKLIEELNLAADERRKATKTRP